MTDQKKIDEARKLFEEQEIAKGLSVEMTSCGEYLDGVVFFGWLNELDRIDAEYAQAQSAQKAEPAPAQDEQQPVLMVRTKGSHTWEQIDAESFELCQQDSDYECREFYPAHIAQTEQQPVAWRRVVERLIANVEIFDERPRPMCRDCADRNGICESGLDCDIRALIKEARAMIAAPIAQTATQPVLYVSKEAFDDPDQIGMHATRGSNAVQGMALYTAPQPEQSGLTWPVIELLSRYKRDLERRTFPDNEQGAFDLRWTAKEIERVSTTLSAQGESHE